MYFIFIFHSLIICLDIHFHMVLEATRDELQLTHICFHAHTHAHIHISPVHLQYASITYLAIDKASHYHV